MACGCGGKTSKPSSREDPIVIGKPDGEVRRVRVTVNFKGLSPGDEGWVTGSHVDALIRQSILVPV